MNKQLIKIIKRTDGKPKPPVAVKDKPKKKRSIENTIQNWISERRENNDTENRARNSEFSAFDSDVFPAEAV